MSRAPDILAGLIIVLALGILGGNLSLWDSSTAPLFSTSKVGLFWLVGAGIIGLIVARHELLGGLRRPEAWAWSLVILCLTDWLNHDYSFFQGPLIRGEVILGAVLWALFGRRLRIEWYALAAPAFLAGYFLYLSGGSNIYSDDHPTFLYRLQLLKQNFPSIPFYNPLWNNGIDAREFFATGALNIFLLTAPLIYLTDIFKTYNLIVIFVPFILLPISVYFAARIAGLSRPGTALAALLSITTSLVWYRWMFKYGTLGFLTSASLAPLVIALGIRLLTCPERLAPPKRIVFVAAVSLLVLWSAAGLSLIPLMLWVVYLLLFRFRDTSATWRRTGLWAIALALLCLNLPWVVLFCKVSQVGTFLTSERPSYEQSAESAATAPKAYKAKPAAMSFEITRKILQEKATSTNPLLLLFAIPGLLLLRKGERGLWGVTFLWLIGLGAILSPLKPQLELDRMIVIAILIASIPAAKGLESILSGQRLLLSSVAGSFVLIGPLVTAGVLGNRTLEQYQFAEPIVQNMAQAIKEHGGAGRVLFSGFVLHELSGGHLAPLVFLTGKPLIASSPVHDLWRYTQVFPGPYLERKDEGIDEYLNMYNVTAVMAHERQWREYFQQRPNDFKEVWHEGRFTLFERVGAVASYFLDGTGQIFDQTSSSITVTLKSNAAILKFNYFPFLIASGCSISGEPKSGGINLIKLTDCLPDAPITIKAMSPLQRLMAP